ncbi:ribonuclease, Rne/Rng family, partial [Brevibacterium sandarakinum]
RIIRDVFNEDFSSLVIDGDGAWNTIHEYVEAVAPDLLERVHRYSEDEGIFDHYRVEEQVQKALQRTVNLPSGGSLVIDRTEAMTVIDVNTGKFTGSGGNLEETVTRNNLEAAEEVIRQVRLRDIGGIIVVDFIDMVLESNRDLVVRRLVECLGRDRTKHQVAEVTSLGLVQMTRKRIGTGLAESLVSAGPTCPAADCCCRVQKRTARRRTTAIGPRTTTARTANVIESVAETTSRRRRRPAIPPANPMPRPTTPHGRPLPPSPRPR